VSVIDRLREYAGKSIGQIGIGSPSITIMEAIELGNYIVILEDKLARARSNLELIDDLKGILNQGE
jgi:hypothetical protein